MGECPSNKHSIDRINNNGNYTPKNCRWATQREQLRNTRVNRILTVGGRSLTVAEWAEETGIKSTTIYHRCYMGWTDERAVRTAVV